jgi:hypothetical protein
MNGSPLLTRSTFDPGISFLIRCSVMSAWVCWWKSLNRQSTALPPTCILLTPVLALNLQLLVLNFLSSLLVFDDGIDGDGINGDGIDIRIEGFGSEARNGRTLL